MMINERQQYLRQDFEMIEGNMGVMWINQEIEGKNFTMKYVPKNPEGPSSQLWQSASQSIEMTVSLLNDVQGAKGDLIFANYFQYVIVSEKDGYFELLSQGNQGNLFEYLRNKKLTQFEALKVFDSVLKIVYSLTMASFCNANIRPQQFVKSGGIWKLESLVYDAKSVSDRGSSEYLWDKTYQAPECYERELKDDDYNPAIVWNLGAFIINLLLNTNVLNRKSKLDQYRGQPFTFGALKMKQNIASPQLTSILGAMLHHDPAKRMTLDEVFRCELLSKDVAKHFRDNPNAVGLSNKRSISLSSSNQRLNKKSSEISIILKNKNQLKKSFNEIFENFKAISNISYPKKEFKEETKPKVIDERIIKAKRCYLNQYDRVEIVLFIESKLLELVDKKVETQELIHLGRYAMNLFALMQTNNLLSEMSNGRNSLEIDPQVFSLFLNSEDCKETENKFKTLYSTLLKKNLNPSKTQNILKDSHVDELLIKDHKKSNIKQIKYGWRVIMQKIYETVSKKYLQLRSVERKNNILQTKDSKKYCQYIFLLTFCLCIQKIYAKNQLQNSFAPFYKKHSECLKDYLPFKEFKDFIEYSTKEELKTMAKFLLQRHFQIPTQK